MISNAYANKILNLACGVADNLSMPEYLYLGLSSTEPDPSTGKVTGEPTAASYERIIVGGSKGGQPIFGSAEGGIIKNSKEIHFQTARETFGTMMYFFLSPYESKAKVPTSGTNANVDAILWGEINNGNGVTINTDNGPVVPVFYGEDLQASIDVSLS